MVELNATDGHKLSAYRAEPAAPPKGAVVILHEILGLNSHIRAVSDNFAAQGYVAIAPSLFDRAEAGVELGFDEAGRAKGEQLITQLDMKGALADIQAAIDSVKHAGKVAIVGYGWGGGLAYHSGNYVGDLACVVAYYGEGILDAHAEKRRVPTLLHFGEEDTAVPYVMVNHFRSRRPDIAAYSYPAAQNFDCDQRDAFNAEAAAQAQERTLFWLSQFLVGQAPLQMKNAGAYANVSAKSEKKKKVVAVGEDGPPE
jgi:carboxymethylenebutenolidase